MTLNRNELNGGGTVKKLTLRVLLSAVVLVGAAGIASATACTSPTFTTLATLITATSCTDTFADYSVTFSNFSISGGETAANVEVAANFSTSPLPYSGFTFSDAAGSFPQSPTTVSYEAQITPGSCAVGFTCTLTGFADQVLILDNVGASVTYTNVPGGVNTLSFSDQTVVSPGSISVASPNVATVSATYNGSGTLDYFQGNFFSAATPVSSAPEPSSFFLLGGGLLAFGAVRLRAKRSKV